MAQRWVAPEYGGIDVLRLEEFEPVPPAADEVRIEVRAIGVNPSDAKQLGGGWNPDPARLPLRPGQEIAGVVAELGPGVSGFEVGDEVVAFKIAGGYATSVTVPVDDVFPRPAALPLEEAANLLHVGVTAAELIERSGVAPGETLLVHGASGSVGASILQQLAGLGIHVIGTGSAGAADRIRALGGDPVEYGEGLAERVRELAPTIDAAIDAAGTPEALDVSLELVGDPDRIATVAPGPKAKEAGVHAVGGEMPGSIAFRMPARAGVLGLAAAGRLQVPTAHRLPFAAAPDALRLVLAGHPGGKVVLIP